MLIKGYSYYAYWFVLQLQVNVMHNKVMICSQSFLRRQFSA